MQLNAVMCHSPSGNFLLFKNKKGDLFPLFKTHAQLCLEPRHQTVPHKWQISWFFRSFRPVGEHRGRRLGYLKGKKKGGLKTNECKISLKRFFWHCTGLVIFFSKYYLFFDNNFYVCPKCLKKESLSQHCSSVQTHHGPDLSSIAGIYGSCGQPSDNSESISKLRNKKIRASCSCKTEEGDQFCFKPVRIWCPHETPRSRNSVRRFVWAASDSAAGHCWRHSLGCSAIIMQTACFSSSTITVVRELLRNTF